MEMEISQEITKALRLLGTYDQKRQLTVAQEAVELLTADKTFSSHSTCCSASDVFTAFATFITEAAKRSLNNETLSTILFDLNWSKDSIESVLSLYQQYLPSIRHSLVCITSSLAHIVDVDWKLQHDISDVSLEQKPLSSYVLKLSVREGGALRSINLKCSVAQLIACVDSLKQANATLAKLAA